MIVPKKEGFVNAEVKTEAENGVRLQLQNDLIDAPMEMPDRERGGPPGRDRPDCGPAAVYPVAGPRVFAGLPYSSPVRRFLQRISTVAT